MGGEEDRPPPGVLPQQGVEKLRAGKVQAAGGLVQQQQAGGQSKGGDEGGLLWSDETIGVQWPIEEGMELIISEKDKKWGGFNDTFKFER